MIEFAQTGDENMPDGQTVSFEARFESVEALCAGVKDWNLEFLPLSAAGTDTGVATLLQGVVDGFPFTYARLFSALDQRGASPPGCYTFTVMAPSMRSLWWQGRDVMPEDVLVYSPGEELRSLSGTDFECQLLSLTEEQVGAIAEQEEMPLPPPARRPTVFRPPESLRRRLWKGMTELRGAVASGAAVDSMGIATDLVQCWLRHAGIAEPRGGRRKVEAVITASLDQLQADPASPISPVALARRVGVSRRTLEYAFRDRFGQGPASFFKTVRLNAARRILLCGERGDVSVGDAMASAGFGHVGQFASDYRRAFGERPSDTLRRSG